MNMQLVEKLMRGNSEVCIKYRQFVESGLTHEKAVQMIYGKKNNFRDSSVGSMLKSVLDKIN